MFAGAHRRAAILIPTSRMLVDALFLSFQDRRGAVFLFQRSGQRRMGNPELTPSRAGGRRDPAQQAQQAGLAGSTPVG
jgi:hypothetical protein